MMNDGSARRSKPNANDDSTIFSLDQLTANAGPAPSSPGSSRGGEEDSGLIDLKALAAGVPTDSVLSGPLDILGGAPALFDAPAPQPVVADAIPARRSGSSSLLIGVLACSVLGLGAAMAFVLVRGAGPSPAQAQAAVTTVVVTPPAAPTQDPSSEAPAAVSAEPSATAASKNALPKGKLGGKGPASPQAQPETAPAAAAPAKPAAGPCGCMPEDLMCNMRCAQKNKKK